MTKYTMSTRSALVTFFVATIASVSVAAADQESPDWSQWRGSMGSGVSATACPPTSWGASSNVRWRTDVPGHGHSSPVVRHGRVFITTQIDEGTRKQLLTICYSLQTGAEIWRHDFGFGLDQPTHATSNLAANTPYVTDYEVLVAFGNAELAAYSLDGQLRWVERLVGRFGNPREAWGWGASPVVYGKDVLFLWDHHAGPCKLLGLSVADGQVAWEIDRAIGTCHATPLVVQRPNRVIFLVSGKNRLTAYDAASRQQLWQFGEGSGPFNGEIIVSPVCQQDVVFTQLWRKSPIHAIRLKPDDSPPELLWTSAKPGAEQPSLLVYQGMLYAIGDNGVLTCYEALSGRECFHRRLDGEFRSSPVAANHNIYFTNTSGTTFVIAAGDKYVLLASNCLSEAIVASPALTSDSIISRTDAALWRFAEPLEIQASKENR